MEVSDQLHAPAALPPRKEPWYPLDRRLGRPQSRSGRGGKISLHLMSLLNPGNKVKAQYRNRTRRLQILHFLSRSTDLDEI